VDNARKNDLGRKGFANGALYNAARPSYPAAAINYFVSKLRIEGGMHVLDLGAGTGIFSRQILPFVARLTAVDPSASMREALALSSPEIEVLEGSDVAIPLEDDSVDAVFVAQAFHWFDPPRALREIHRVLTRGGGLGMIWNERDESVEWVAAMSHAMQWDTKAPYKIGTDFSEVIGAGPFINVERMKFDNPQTISHDGLYQRVLSASYISVMEDHLRDDVMKDVAKVVEKLPDPVVLPHVTDVYTARAQ